MLPFDFERVWACDRGLPNARLFFPNNHQENLAIFSKIDWVPRGGASRPRAPGNARPSCVREISVEREKLGGGAEEPREGELGRQ